MGQLEEEIKEASRGRMMPHAEPDHVDHERHKKETERSFEKVLEEHEKLPSRP